MQIVCTNYPGTVLYLVKKCQVLRRWKHRWSKSAKVPPFGYEQVTNCLDLALRCVHMDPIERPNIWDIIRDLDKMDCTVHNSNDIEYANDQVSSSMLS